MYCHTYARRSMVAGIPPLQKCIGCHMTIESVRETPRIQKLFEYWDAKKPIPWKKVHDLPDFVRFNHERHIQRFYFQQDKPVSGGMRLLPRRCEDHDGGASPETADHGLVRELPPEGSSGRCDVEQDRAWSERLLAVPQISDVTFTTARFQGDSVMIENDFNRRDFLKVLGWGGAAVTLSGCGITSVEDGKETVTSYVSLTRICVARHRRLFQFDLCAVRCGLQHQRPCARRSRAQAGRQCRFRRSTAARCAAWGRRACRRTTTRTVCASRCCAPATRARRSPGTRRWV